MIRARTWVMVIICTSVFGAIPSMSSAETQCVWKTRTVFINGQARTEHYRSCSETDEPEPEVVEGGTSGEDPSNSLSPGCPPPSENLYMEDCQAFQSVEDPAPRRRLTIGMITSAFRDTPIPASRIVVQPPGGKTLVNFETIFRTEAATFTESFRLLGQPIDLRISPSSFRWRPGDGASFFTTTPGIAFEEGRSMDDYVTHSYQAAEVVHPRVDVTWSAQFRVGGGAWRSVPGTVTKQGTPVDLRVVEGKPVLVDAY